MKLWIRLGITWVASVTLVCAQQPPPPEVAPPPGAGQQATEQTKPQPQAEPAKPATPSPAVPQPAATLIPTPSGQFVLNLQNASLTEVIDILARQLKINYILDPRIKGSVTLNTYGELVDVDIRALLETILRVNGAALIQVGQLYRIVPLPGVSRLPLRPQINPKVFPENERMVLNLVFLKYATVGDLSALLEKFLGEGATMVTYEPANLLLLMDNNRNMNRTMEMIALFDSDVLASQRVRLLEVENGRPTDIANELETILSSVSLGEKGTSVRFMPIDRINIIIAVAPNPGVFDEVEKWLKKLDVPVKVTAGSVQNYVYRVKYGRAPTLAGAIMQLYFGYSGFGGAGGFGYGGFGAGFGSYGGVGAFPGAGYGGVGAGYGAGYGGGYPTGAYPGSGFAPFRQSMTSPRRLGQTGTQTTGGAAATRQGAAGATTPLDLTGSYLGSSYGYGYGYGPATEGMPRVVPNPLDNSLLIQATPQDYRQILNLLEDLDVPPRQVLIEAKIYEVQLTDEFASGVSAFLNKRGEGEVSLPTNLLLGSSGAAGLSLTAGMLVGQSRELLAFLTTQEDNRRAKIISAPSLIATDSIPALINVGQEVPTLTSQALTGAQIGGTNLFTNTVQSRSSGVTLQILAQVNPSGIVTLEINQDISSPVAPSANAAIQSPSFSKRTIQTQATVQDGDTIAIAGIILETETHSSAGIPLLHRIPVLGAAFGAKSISKDRTELIVFMTPRVIYDTNQIVEASEEVKSKLRRLTKMIKD
jgi:general secretion pathway protein D